MQSIESIVYRIVQIYTHIEVNPVGKLEVEIVELQERHITEFEDLSFEIRGAQTRIYGKEGMVPWQFNLAKPDALELPHLVDEANEEYETSMRDLM